MAKTGQTGELADLELFSNIVFTYAKLSSPAQTEEPLGFDPHLLPRISGGKAHGNASRGTTE